MLGLDVMPQFLLDLLERTKIARDIEICFAIISLTFPA